MEDFYGFIYITTNNVNGKKYIGKRSFACGWKSYLGSGKLLKQAIIKYGKTSFTKEIIDYAKTKEDLSEKEKYYIKLFDAVNSNNYYNLEHGGQGNGLSGEKSPQYGKEAPNTNKSVVICENLITGEKIEFTNITKFAKENNFLPSKISTMLRKNKGSHKNCIFYYKDNSDNKSVKYNRTKNIIEEDLNTRLKIVIDNVNEHCLKYGISKSSLYNCLKGKYYQNKDKIYYYEGEMPLEKPKVRKFVATNIDTNEVHCFENVDEFCKQNNLTFQRVYACINGSQKSKTTKGFRIQEVNN